MYQYNCIFFLSVSGGKTAFLNSRKTRLSQSPSLLLFTQPQKTTKKNSRFRFVLEKNFKLARRVGKFTVRRVQLKHRTVGNSLFE